MRQLDAGHARDGYQELRLLRPGHVIYKVAGEAGAVELVLVGRGIIPDVEIVITNKGPRRPVQQHRRLDVVRNRHRADQTIGRVAGQYLLHVVNVGVPGGRRHGGEEEHAAVGVLVQIALMRPTQPLLVSDTADFLHLRRVRQPSDVEDDRDDVGIGSALVELEGFDVVVAAAELEVLSARGRTLMQFGILDPPGVHHGGLLRIPEVHDVKPGQAGAGDVRVRP